MSLARQSQSLNLPNPRDFEVNFSLRPVQKLVQHVSASSSKRMSSVAQFMSYMAPNFMKSSSLSSHEEREVVDEEMIGSMPDFMFPAVFSVAHEEKVDAEPFQDLMHLKPEKVIVGGGPVGLYAAIEHKRLLPESAVLILERYEKFVRTPVLRIQLNDLANQEVKKRLLELVREGQASIKKDFFGTEMLHIDIKLLQESLLNYARELGVAIHFKKVASHQQVQATFPEAIYITGADGSHSMMRHSIFNEEPVDHPFQFLVKVDYKIQGQAGKTGKNAKLHQEILAGVHCDETIKYDEEKDVSTVSANFFFKENEFKSIQGGTFKDPLVLSHALPKEVQEVLSVWLNTRRENWLATPVLTKIKLSAYASEHFCKEERGTLFSLIGDAAFGVPYFRSLNAGLKCASIIAKLEHHLHAALKSGDLRAKEKFVKEYNHAIKNAFAKEFLAATIKDIAVDSGLSSGLMLASSLQSITWNKKDKEIQQLHGIFHNPEAKPEPVSSFHIPGFGSFHK